MFLYNQSISLSDIIMPSKTIFKTLLLDSHQDFPADGANYEKIILVSKSRFEREIPEYTLVLSHSSISGYICIYQKPNLVCDVSFVIQGLDHEHTLFTILYSALYGSVCLGIWGDDLESAKKFQEARHLDNYYNKFFQTLSTIKGLEQVKTKYVIKLRSDEYFLNYIGFIERMKALSPHKILTSNIYFRKINVWPFHISDHIIGSETINLLRMFINSYNNILNGIYDKATPEVHLGASYLQQFTEINIHETVSYKTLSLMITFFDIYPIQEFEEYKTKYRDRWLSKADGVIRDFLPTDNIADITVD